MRKNITRILWSAVFVLLGSIARSEEVCPDWLMNRANSIPTCPDGGLVPETFPAGAVVVADRGMKGKDSNFTADVIEKVLKASGKNNPLIILPVSKETMERVRSRIDGMPIAKNLKNQYKRSLLHIPSKGFTWQQDYFQPFVDPSTGRIVLRKVQKYDRQGDDFDKIMEATKACGFERGPLLENDKFVGGHSGGNIETLPQGICLLGDDHFGSQMNWEDYANQICNSGDENRIKVPTSWLSVGHTDEILKVVKNRNAPAPCDFAVVLASPRKAIELLEQNPEGKFTDFSRGRGGSGAELAERRSREYKGLRTLCRETSENRARRRPEKKNQSKPQNTVGSLFDLRNLLLPRAQASELVAETSDCTNMTNGDVHRLLTDDGELKIYNQLVQEKMDSLREEVDKKLRRKLPQCKPDFIEAPDLFFGGQPVEIGKGKFELPREMGLSVLPNPTNAISIDDTVISPDPGNKIFHDYMSKQYKSRGLKVDFVDTFDYAHQGSGNLHCSTNTIHICNPKGLR